MKKPSFIQRILHPREAGSVLAEVGADKKEEDVGLPQPASRLTPPPKVSPKPTSVRFEPHGTKPSRAEPTKDPSSRSSIASVPEPTPAKRSSFAPAMTKSLGESLVGKRDDVATRFQEGFRDLGNLLKSINDKLEDHNDTNRVLVENVKPLPGLLTCVSEQLDEQREATAELRTTLGDLKGTSERQMSLMRSASESQKLTVDSFQKTQTRALNAFYRSQKETYENFRKGQASQAKQFESALVRTQKSFTRMLMIFFASVMIAAAAAVIVSRPSPSTSLLGGPGSDGVEAAVDDSATGIGAVDETTTDGE